MEELEDMIFEESQTSNNALNYAVWNPVLADSWLGMGRNQGHRPLRGCRNTRGLSQQGEKKCSGISMVFDKEFQSCLWQRLALLHKWKWGGLHSWSRKSRQKSSPWSIWVWITIHQHCALSLPWVLHLHADHSGDFYPFFFFFFF